MNERFHRGTRPGVFASCARIPVAVAVCVLMWLPVALLTSAAATAAEQSAVVVMYHRFGDPRFPSTNVTLEQVDAHIEELRSGSYSVLPVPEILRRLRDGTGVPPRTVGITVDDAYETFFTEGWPRFRAAGLPVTLFVSTDSADRNLEDMMTWDQIRSVRDDGVTIGAHTASHLHMPDADAATNRDEIDRSNRRYRAELGAVPSLFAYPYGEAGAEQAAIVREAGYDAAFGQHSGAFSDGSDFFYLPRFSMNETYGDLGRFRTAANALALPVTDITPADMLIGGDNPPAMGFTLMRDLPRLDELSCFLSHEGKARVERLGDWRFEVRGTEPFPRGRTRLNCTVPGGRDDAGRWHWFGLQFYRPARS